MGLLPNYTKCFDYKYLSTDFIEFIRTSILSNSPQFISKDRGRRLRWIKSEVGFLLPVSWEGGLLKSIGSWLIDSILFGIFRKNLIDNIDNYRKLGELAFSKEQEALFEATLKNRINWSVLRWADKLVKWRLKKMHNQEEAKRRMSSFEGTIYQIANPVSVEEAVLLNYETLKLFSVREFLYISHWEQEQTNILIKRIDRTFQRFMPCEKMSVKEVMSRLHTKMDELSKEIDAKERIDRKLRFTKENEVALFQTKIELKFYNHFYSNIHIYEQQLKAEERSKENDNIGIVSQHNLMIYYLLEYSKLMRPDVNSTRYGKFVRFLTGMSIIVFGKIGQMQLFKRTII